MTRVAVIGNAGGGKSTLCRKLGAALDLPVYEIDQIQWQPGWVLTPAAEFDRQPDQITRGERWIIDGWGSAEAIRARFEAADTIIMVDHPLWVHDWWAIKRQIMCLFQPREGGPEGCPLPPMTWTLFTLMWRIHRHMHSPMLDLIRSFADRKRVIHLRSPRALRRFVAHYC